MRGLKTTLFIRLTKKRVFRLVIRFWCLSQQWCGCKIWRPYLVSIKIYKASYSTFFVHSANIVQIFRFPLAMITLFALLEGEILRIHLSILRICLLLFSEILHSNWDLEIEEYDRSRFSWKILVWPKTEEKVPKRGLRVFIKLQDCLIISISGISGSNRLIYVIFYMVISVKERQHVRSLLLVGCI